METENTIRILALAIIEQQKYKQLCPDTLEELYKIAQEQNGKQKT